MDFFKNFQWSSFVIFWIGWINNYEELQNYDYAFNQCIFFRLLEYIPCATWHFFLQGFLVGMVILGGGGRGVDRTKRWSLHFCLTWFCFAPFPHDKKNFMLHPCPLRTLRIYLVKLYFLLICSIIITIFFFNKTCFIIKIYLKLQLNLSH